MTNPPKPPEPCESWLDYVLPGKGVPDTAYEYALDELAALREERDRLRARLEAATELLRRVRIYGGAGRWTEDERDEWASNYKDFQNGAEHLIEWK